MSRIVILSVEDEDDVREALERDLQPFAGAFRLEFVSDAAEAREVIQACLDDGDRIGLVLADHLMPGQSGVDLLVDLQHREDTVSTRKVLVTGHASHKDTILAVNEAGLCHYIAKPWTVEILHAAVRHQLTDYVLETEDDLLPYMSVLEADRLMEAFRDRADDR